MKKTTPAPRPSAKVATSSATAAAILEGIRANNGIALPQKSITAVDRIVASCDELQSNKQEITPTTVGAQCAKKFGGPKPQSILNNLRYRAYVGARRAEQGEIGAKTRIGGTSIRTGVDHVDAYLETLESRLAQAEADLRSHRHAMTQLGDYDLRTALETGVLVLVPPQSFRLPLEARQAIEAILDAANLGPVGLELVNTGQIISKRFGSATLLNKFHVDALKGLLSGH